MRKNKTLILSQKDVAEILKSREQPWLFPTSAISMVEEAFCQYGIGKTQMPPKIYLDLKEFSGDFRAMPSYVPKFNLCTLKWVNAHPQNPNLGFPLVMAVIIVSDPKTGFPLAIMDGTLATSLRTGAGGAVAAKYLARKDSQILALVGCGVQARTQLMALREIFKIKEVRVWGHQQILSQKFVKQMKIKNEVMTLAGSIRECVEGADIVITTTPSHKPIVELEWIKKGAHINAIGADAPGKQELDPQILQNAKVIVDDLEQSSHSGEINVPITKGIFKIKDIHATLGEIICGKKKGRTNNEEITVFDSTGLAIQDTAIAHLIYKTALKKKLGQRISLV